MGLLLLPLRLFFLFVSSLLMISVGIFCGIFRFITGIIFMLGVILIFSLIGGVFLLSSPLILAIVLLFLGVIIGRSSARREL